MNLLNYVDRYSFFAAGTHIQRDLHIDDYWFGVAGRLVHDRVYDHLAADGLAGRSLQPQALAGRRRRAYGAWRRSATAFSGDFYHMFFWRALLGVGEASYGVIAPALLVGPVPGQAAGPGDGGVLSGPAGRDGAGVHAGRHDRRRCWGWRAVFFVVGLPGSGAALAGLVMQRPRARRLGGGGRPRQGRLDPA